MEQMSFGAEENLHPPSPLADRYWQPSSLKELCRHPSFRAPHRFNQHRNTHNQKNQQASTSGSKCTAMTKLEWLWDVQKKNQPIRLFSPARYSGCPGGGGGTVSVPCHHLPCLQSHRWAKEPKGDAHLSTTIDLPHLYYFFQTQKLKWGHSHGLFCPGVTASSVRIFSAMGTLEDEAMNWCLGGGYCFPVPST